MYQYHGLEDTIVAISTPVGHGAIGIIRLSGKDAIVIGDRIFKAKNNKLLAEAKSFTVHYGWIQKDADIIDEVMVTVIRAPRSYTTEDILEINCHGGPVALKSILNFVLESGARLAEPGEFTKRAFLNGRIDLTQAEAVLDVIQSKTDAFLKISTHQLKGELSTELESIREILMDIYTEIEAIINFPEDEIDAQSKGNIIKAIELAGGRVQNLLLSAEQGRLLKDGIKLVLCGRPNVGKSSLLNLLLKTPRAIVSDIAGTTRDTIEEDAQINGIPFRLVDTAGILEPRDLIEKEAVHRSHQHIKAADLVLFVIDSSEELSDQDYALMDMLEQQNVIVVFNKCDLKCMIENAIVKEKFLHKPIVRVSVLKKEGMADLEQAVVEQILPQKRIDTDRLLVSSVRHINALKECLTVLTRAQESMNGNAFLEVVSEDVKRGVNFLDAITGRNIDNDLLDTIFSQFCIGK